MTQAPGVDICLIARFDLAKSYGYCDGPDHDEVHAATARDEQAIRGGAVHLGACDHRGAGERHDRLRLPADPDRLRHHAAAAAGEALKKIDRGD